MLKNSGDIDNNKKKVIISFDAEFSINGAFADPEHKQPCADAIFAPNPEGTEGLTDILTILSSHQVKATFFAEVLNSYYFGNSKMLKYVQQMVEYKQDIQLHTHPCWLIFKEKNWQDKISSRLVCDDFDGTCKKDIVKVLSECLDIFKQWDVPRPVAYRAGNLHPKLALYDALDELGFTVSSSVDLPIYVPKEPQLRTCNKAIDIHNITEFPVTSFKSMGVREKALTITGCSFMEMKKVLTESLKKDTSPIVILSHVHEFIKKQPISGKVVKNKVNLNRLNQLCQFINQDSRFQFTTFAQLACQAHKNKTLEKSTNKLNCSLSTPVVHGLWTLTQNKINDYL